jgi:hypothetical protein
VRPESSGQRGWNRIFEEEPDVPTPPGSRPFESGREAQAATRGEKGRCILLPAGLVEVDGQDVACLVLKQGIDASDKAPAFGVVAGPDFALS